MEEKTAELVRPLEPKRQDRRSSWSRYKANKNKEKREKEKRKKRKLIYQENKR